MKRTWHSQFSWGLALLAGVASARAVALGGHPGAAISNQDIQAPRASDEDIQAPVTGNQDIQAPRSSGQDIQAPRG